MTIVRNYDVINVIVVLSVDEMKMSFVEDDLISMVYVKTIYFVIDRIKVNRKEFVSKVRMTYFLCKKIEYFFSILACWKFQCLSVVKDNKTTCECASRSVPCDKNLYFDTKDNCENRSTILIENNSPTLNNELIDCSNIICQTSSNCPSDSHFLEDHTPLLRSSFPLSKNLSSICCESRGQCVCSSCPKTICGENSIIQIYRTGNPHLPGQCCDQLNCFKSR